MTDIEETPEEQAIQRAWASRPDRCPHQSYMDYEVILIGQDVRCRICNKFKHGDPENDHLYVTLINRADKDA